ncbi:MAG: UDP-N-acetylmuramate:L-alanyl-gamma-D-glutamyl-meso-diaminopimelate ligase [Candidatus Hydrogenedentes bacterium]|nr:UDP-N-acetylmuramate:L-alanyl-gamma-D-glutamyl-meso-diaminopimelate ligase [Candidatus Hydrogenedentota bacterium]
MSFHADRPPRVHFSGIGGTAMVAGARLALEAGWEVRGSDGPLYPPTSDLVRALNVPVAESYATENLDWEPDLVVVGNALSRGNAELEAVLERGLHYVSLPEWLRDVVLRARTPIVIAGTHGKTTTTTLTAYLLDRGGANPGYLIGGQALDFEHSARLGAEGAPFVIEGDEYDSAFFDKRAKFLHYLPAIAVVTSIEFDHADIYDNIREIEIAFERLLRQIPASGQLIACADHARSRALCDDAPCRTMTYGFDDAADWRAVDTGILEGMQTFDVHRDGQVWGAFSMPLIGRHNVSNALAAIAVAEMHDISPESIQSALRAFKGVRRRMETFHEAEGIVFIDDFAHHPTAITEVLRAARSRWPENRLVVLLEPRTNTLSTNRFQFDIARSLQGADLVWLGPIHRADRIPEDKRLDRDLLADTLRGHDVEVWIAGQVDAMVEELRAEAQPGDVVLVLSNGAFGGIYDLLRKAFQGSG